MKFHAQTTLSQRFDLLLSEGAADRPLCDRPLLRERDWIAAPSLGAVVPGWLLILPTRPALNFKQWAKESHNPVTVLSEVEKRLGLEAGEYIWFEHGPSQQGTAVGCGVDYAHLHLLIRPPFTFDDMLSKAIQSSGVTWMNADADSAYSEIPSHVSYLVVGQGKRAAIAHNVESLGSQFLRRMVATVAGHKDAWNYRVHPHEDNIARTVDQVRALESAVLARGN